MEGKADKLIAATDDFLVAEAAGDRQGQLIVLGLFDQMQYPIKLLPRFGRLAIQALRQQHREAGRFHIKDTADHGRIDALGTGGHQIVSLLGQGAPHEFNQMDGHHGHMATAKNGNAPLAPVLEHGQLLGQRVDPTNCWKI